MKLCLFTILAPAGSETLRRVRVVGSVGSHYRRRKKLKQNRNSENEVLSLSLSLSSLSLTLTLTLTLYLSHSLSRPLSGT